MHRDLDIDTIRDKCNDRNKNTSNQWRLFSTSERDSLKYLRIVTLLIKRRESYDYWKGDGYNKKGAKKNSGEQWRSKLYRRLIGPICQFIASTKKQPLFPTQFPAPDIAVRTDLPNSRKERP